MNAISDLGHGNDGRDDALLAAYGRFEHLAGSPAPAVDATLLAAARVRAAVVRGRHRRRQRLALLGLVIGAAFAFAAIVQGVLQHKGSAPPAIVAAAATDHVVAAPTPTPPKAPAVIAPPASRPGARPVPSGLRLKPPGPSPFQAMLFREISAHFQALLDSSDPRTWVAGLLFDHARHVVRVADAVPFPDPVDGKPDPVLGDSLRFGQQAFGLRPSQYDDSGGVSLPQPPLEGHPRIMVWYYVLRDAAELHSEDAVRAAVFAHFRQALPPHDATAEVPVMTLLMTADGHIDRYDLQYRPALGGALTAETYAGDRAARFAALGVRAGDAGRRGSMMVASDDLPGGVPGGLVMVDYALPPADADAQSARENGAAAAPNFAFDTQAAVVLLHALFTQQQLDDLGDGQEPWVLLDGEGSPLKWGRAENSKDLPIQGQLMQWFPTVRVENAWQGQFDDPASLRRQVDGNFFWLAPDSPRP